MSNRDDVCAVIAREMAAGGIEVTVAELHDGTDLYAEIGADDLDIITIVMALERDFAIELSDDACDGVRTVGDLVGLVAIAQAKARWGPG